ncbi:hypothetical protein VNO80_28428 [Phaseolus coccineus]|uniref:Uncharacterized protein n=1 Tax=Phaseolus coccineus TaxID=3886 RepID=A0AAN9LAC9_PHACN
MTPIKLRNIFTFLANPKSVCCPKSYCGQLQVLFFLHFLLLPWNLKLNSQLGARRFSRKCRERSRERRVEEKRKLKSTNVASFVEKLLLLF